MEALGSTGRVLKSSKSAREACRSEMDSGDMRVWVGSFCHAKSMDDRYVRHVMNMALELWENSSTGLGELLSGFIIWWKSAHLTEEELSCPGLH